MQHLIKHEPSFPLLQVGLAPNEVLVAEAGTMVARASTVDMRVRLNASRREGAWAKLKAIFVALLRKLVGGETFFVSEFSSPAGGWVWLAPAMSGSIRHMPLRGGALLLTSGAFVASSADIDLKLKWGGLRAILAREGAFLIEASGTGDLWFTSYGAVEEIQVDGSFIVDSGHLVAFEPSLGFQIKSAGGGLLGFVASGEGLVCEFTGRGKVFVQTRNTGALVNWVSKLLP